MATPARVALAWCDSHHDFVDEGRVHPLAAGSQYQVCDGCRDEARYTVDHPHLAALFTTLDHGLTIEDRAAAYAVLYAIRLVIHRRLQMPKAELMDYMAREGVRALGPLSLASTAEDVRWPCNDPGNWTDLGIQEAMDELAGRPDTAPYIRTIPHHREIDTRALGADVALGVSGAVRLWKEMKARGWRTEGTRRRTLQVKTSPTLGGTP